MVNESKGWCQDHGLPFRQRPWWKTNKYEPIAAGKSLWQNTNGAIRWLLSSFSVLSCEHFVPFFSYYMFSMIFVSGFSFVLTPFTLCCIHFLRFAIFSVYSICWVFLLSYTIFFNPATLEFSVLAVQCKTIIETLPICLSESRALWGFWSRWNCIVAL